MTAGEPQRLAALDVFRGATVAAMILVNNPGSWAAIYAPLRHAAWHGCTPTDLIFPFFLFIVGASIAIAIGRRLAAGVPRGALLRKIVRRGVSIIAIGLLLHAYPRVVPRALLGAIGLDSLDLGAELAGLRLPGVLQRIGLCYTVAACLFVFLRPRWLAVITAVLLAGYHALLSLPVPGGGGADLDRPGMQLGAWIDRTVFGEAHLWSQSRVHDPEGLLSTLPAIATVLLGIGAGLVLRAERPLRARVSALLMHGTVLAAVGYLYGAWLPFNKALWTSSYVLWTGGLAGLALGCCLYLCDVLRWRRFAEPFRLYGVHAIFVFAGSALLVKTAAWIQVGDGAGGSESLRAWIYRIGFQSWLDGELASLAYAVAQVLAWLVVLWWMDRRGLHLKV